MYVCSSVCACVHVRARVCACVHVCFVDPPVCYFDIVKFIIVMSWLVQGTAGFR